MQACARAPQPQPPRLRQRAGCGGRPAAAPAARPAPHLLAAAAAAAWPAAPSAGALGAERGGGTAAGGSGSWRQSPLVQQQRQQQQQRQEQQRCRRRLRPVCRQQGGAAAAAAGDDPPGGNSNSEVMATLDMIEAASSAAPPLQLLNRLAAPRWLFRTVACLILGGQVVARICRGKIHWRNTKDQLQLVGPKSLGVALLTAGFVGMVFTIQFVREFAKLGLTRSVGGVLALALARELTPVVTSIILAGRVGSAFAAELGTMQVSEQVDSLRVLFTDPVDYLVTPRVLASMIAGPILNVLCFCMGVGASVLLADLVYDVPANVILDSARRALTGYDVVTSCVKAWVFGLIISTISCAWGFTTTGGAKGVGESTTSAVVISLVMIFVADFILSFLFFQGQGDALKQLK